QRLLAREHAPDPPVEEVVGLRAVLAAQLVHALLALGLGQAAHVASEVAVGALAGVERFLDPVVAREQLGHDALGAERDRLRDRGRARAEAGAVPQVLRAARVPGQAGRDGRSLLLGLLRGGRRSGGRAGRACLARQEQEEKPAVHGLPNRAAALRLRTDTNDLRGARFPQALRQLDLGRGILAESRRRSGHARRYGGLLRTHERPTLLAGRRRAIGRAR